MAKEFGSFFEFNPNIHTNIINIKKNYKYIKNKYFFISGRVGIRYIINNINCKYYLLPNYLCESIISNFYNTNYELYKINNDFSINFNFLKKIINKNIYRCIYIIDYFGNIDNNIHEIINLCEKNNIIIIQDFTHNIKKKLYGDICISSFRKYLPSAFGCIVCDNINILPAQNKNISFKIAYLNILKLIGMIFKSFGFFKKFWYYLLCYCENEIDKINDNNFDYINCLFFLFYNFNNINLRKKNYKYLKINCIYKPILTIKSYFIYPILFKSIDIRNEIKNKLIKNNIYPIIYWPLNFKDKNKCNNYLSDHILCIPIDERYSINDMTYICNILNG